MDLPRNCSAQNVYVTRNTIHCGRWEMGALACPLERCHLNSLCVSSENQFLSYRLSWFKFIYLITDFLSITWLIRLYTWIYNESISGGFLTVYFQGFLPNVLQLIVLYWTVCHTKLRWRLTAIELHDKMKWNMSLLSRRG